MDVFFFHARSCSRCFRPQLHARDNKFSYSNQVRAEAEFYEFAPAPCSCLACLASDDHRKRLYAKAFDNRLEYNLPCAPFYCITTEICLVDQIYVSYFDKQPTRVGMCCFCIPATCCGPPVLFIQQPYICCCINVSAYCGETLTAAPCNCYGLKKYLCCGAPCYTCCSAPLIPGIKDGKKFLAAYKSAAVAFAQKTGLPQGEMAIFETVADSEIDYKSAETVGAPAQQSM